MLLGERIREFAAKGRKRVAIGLDPKMALPLDFSAATSICDVVVVGRHVPGYECIETDFPENVLVDQLLSQRVDGVVRGQLDHTKFAQHLLRQCRLQWSDLHLVSLLQFSSNELWLAPVSNSECWIKREKVLLVRKMLGLYHALDLDARVALISGVRRDDLGPQWYFDGMYYDCEEIVTQFASEIEGRGWVRHFSIESERAIETGANILIMPNGMVGNQCYRLLVYTGVVECLVNLVLGAGLNIVTNSRNETRLCNYFTWAAAVANGLVSPSAL